MRIFKRYVYHADKIGQIEDVAADMPAEKTERLTSAGNFHKIAASVVACYCAILGARINHAVINTVVTKIVTETGANGTIATISYRNKGNRRNGKTRFSVT